MGLALTVVLALGACGTTDDPNHAAETMSPETALRLASVAESNHDYQSAAGLIQKAIAERPKDPSLKVALAQAFIGANAPNQASAILKQALELDPTRTDARLLLGDIALDQHDPKGALDQFGQILATDPKNIRAMNGEGIAYDLTGRSANAQAVYRAALVVSPEDPATRNNLGLSLTLSGRYDEAIAILEKLILEPGATPRMRQNLSLALGLKGKDDEAAKVAHADLDDAQTDANMHYYDTVRGLLLQTDPTSEKIAPGKS